MKFLLVQNKHQTHDWTLIGSGTTGLGIQEWSVNSPEAVRSVNSLEAVRSVNSPEALKSVNSPEAVRSVNSLEAVIDL